MGKKTIIIIGTIVTAVGGIGYMLFSDKPSNVEQANQSFTGRNAKREKLQQATTSSTQSQSETSIEIYSKGDVPIKSLLPTNQSTQTSGIYLSQSNYEYNNANPAYRSYFTQTPILSPRQIFQSKDGTYNDYNPSSNTSNISSGANSGSLQTTTNEKKIAECTQVLQPILSGNVTDPTTINNSLMNIMGFSMLDSKAQNTYISDIATKKYGDNPNNYCTKISQSTDASTLQVANLYNDCTSIVQNFYKTNGSNATEETIINAFTQLNILNGAQTTEQKKQLLQNYFGSNYTYIINGMKSLNSKDLEQQTRQICAKIPSSIVSGLNGTSPYLDCVKNIINAKTNNIKEASVAIAGFNNISQSNQEKLKTYYASFLTGSKSASEICTFLIENTPNKVASQNTNTLTSQTVVEACSSLITVIANEYNSYIAFPQSDPIEKIIYKLPPYQFFITDSQNANVIKYLITNQINNQDFISLSQQQQYQISQRLYSTYLSINHSGNSLANPREFYSNLCKCMHIDFDDIAWKNAVQSYLSSQKTGYTVPFNNIESQAMISSSPFYQSCYNESNPKSSLIVSKLTSSTTTITTIAQAVKSINTSYAQIPQIEDKIADLACYSQSCVNSICSMSCLNKVQAVCEKLTLEYIKSNPTSNASNAFNCPVSTDSINNKPICYDLTNAKRDAIGNNLNKVMGEFQLKASDVRKNIIEELWLIHKQKQEKTNTSASITDCNQVANTKWSEFFKPYIQGQQ